MARGPTLDKIDIAIIQVLLRNCRASYRSISLSVGLSKNAVKTRIDKLFSAGIISRFAISVNPAVFGYSVICHLIVRDSKTMEETSNRLRLLGEPLVRLDCIGGVSMFEIAVREEEKIRLLADALKPALVQSCIVGKCPPARQKLRETDFEIIRCLISNPRMAVSEIARNAGVSSKTVTNRLAKMKENKILNFFVYTEPVNMQGYVRFGMIIRLEGGNSGGHQKAAKQVHEKLEKNFVMAFPMIIQEGVMVWQLIVKSLFEIDPTMKKIESLNGVQGAEVFIPFKADLYQDWAQREIDSRVNHAKGRPAVSIE